MVEHVLGKDEVESSILFSGTIYYLIFYAFQVLLTYMEKTLSIIKPDGVRRNLVGKILSMYQENGFKIAGQKMIQFSPELAEKFYAVHKERPFFKDLCSIMSKGPVSVQILEKENAVQEHRDLIGSTNPKDSKPGTIRRLFGISIDENTVHGSDSVENAAAEIALLFSDNEKF